MRLTLYASTTIGDAKNCIYPNKHVIDDARGLAKIVGFDHVCGEFKNHYRSKQNFISSNVDVFDNDNEHSDDPNEWIHVEDYEFIFGNVNYVVVPSRNNLKVKDGKTTRPRHHVYFPHKPFTTVDECESFKQKIYNRYKFFDPAALDAARFIYANPTLNANIIWHEGACSIDETLKDPIDLFAVFDDDSELIHSGSRNSSMSKIAARLVKRYGNTAQAKQLFLEYAERCTPPLSDSELGSIWRSALRFGERISQEPDYVPPEQYGQQFMLEPDDYSDMGQALMLAKEYGDVLRHSDSTDFMVYNGSFWEESTSKAQGITQTLTERQLTEAQDAVDAAMNEMGANGALQTLLNLGAKKAVNQFSPKQRNSYDKYEKALAYQKYALKRRDSRYIWAALKEVKPLIPIEQKQLDVDEFLLNTPSYSIDLKTGETREHSSKDYVTKQTLVDPSGMGADLWLDAVDTFFKGNRELIDYVQKIVGLSVIGKVYVEALIIAYGEGRNGKSTFWNTIARVLGTYAGTISADILTVGCRRNVKPELAEARGKRLLIAAELEEGMRLNTSNVKQLCSTDEITAEKKYKSPFAYTPSHTLVLYTNHLPRVGAIDKGTWRRLIVIPFNAKLEGDTDIKNYADYLFTQAGGAVLAWIVEGARKVIADNYNIKPPQIVEEASSQYREDNDWFNRFMETCCDIGDEYTEKSGQLYSEYRAYCSRMGEFARSTTDFYGVLEQAEFPRKRTSKGVLVLGLKLKSEFAE